MLSYSCLLRIGFYSSVIKQFAVINYGVGFNAFLSLLCSLACCIVLNVDCIVLLLSLLLLLFFVYFSLAY